MPADGIRVATFDCYGTLIDWEGGLERPTYEWRDLWGLAELVAASSE